MYIQKSPANLRRLAVTHSPGKNLRKSNNKNNNVREEEEKLEIFDCLKN